MAPALRASARRKAGPRGDRVIDSFEQFVEAVSIAQPDLTLSFSYEDGSQWPWACAPTEV